MAANNEPVPSAGDAAPIPQIAKNPTEHTWLRREALEGSLETADSSSPTRSAWSPVEAESKTHAHRAAPPPPLPGWVKAGGAILGLAILAGASWAGFTLGTSPTPEPSPTATQVIREWQMEPPVSVQDWVRGEVETPPPVEGQNRTVIRADYSTGQERLVLVLSRTELDLNQYLSDANIGNTRPVGHSICGTSLDTGSPVCARLADETGILIAGRDAQTHEELAPIVDEFYWAMSGVTPEQDTLTPSALVSSPSASPEQTP